MCGFSIKALRFLCSFAPSCIMVLFLSLGPTFNVGELSVVHSVSCSRQLCQKQVPDFTSKYGEVATGAEELRLNISCVHSWLTRTCVF